MYNKKTLRDVAFNGKKVMLRLDLNVPIIDGKIIDKNRIERSIPTINFLLNAGARVVILSHFDRVSSLDDIRSGKKSLFIVFRELQSIFNTKKAKFVPDIDFDTVKEQVEQDDFDICMLENTRYYDVNSLDEHVKWESKNFPVLAKFWAELGDVFVNDAFATCHREHASNYGIATFSKESCYGFLIEDEIKNLDDAINSPLKPKTVIFGGSKISDKLGMVKNLINKVDNIIVGGGLSYTFLKAKGKNIGTSILEEHMVDECKRLLQDYPDKIHVPVDHYVTENYEDVKGVATSSAEEGWTEGMSLDIGPNTVAKFTKVLDKSKVVIWNGPVGVFEFSNYEEGTKQIALKLAEITEKGAFTVIGGGDSAAAVKKFGLEHKYSFISTGGGACLCYLEGGILPSISVLSDKE